MNVYDIYCVIGSVFHLLDRNSFGMETVRAETYRVEQGMVVFYVTSMNIGVVEPVASFNTAIVAKIVRRDGKPAVAITPPAPKPRVRRISASELDAMMRKGKL